MSPWHLVSGNADTRLIDKVPEQNAEGDFWNFSADKLAKMVKVYRFYSCRFGSGLGVHGTAVTRFLCQVRIRGNAQSNPLFDGPGANFLDPLDRASLGR